MTIHRHCVVCGQELDAFDIKAHKCVPKEYYQVRDSSSQKIIKELSDRIAELENQLDKCSHHEAMAHQGGYEIGKASQIKELSDEEIINLYKETKADNGGIREFVRAILKKANEK